jgi:DNA invertase Pin-like site-specific DNA recombinase
LLQDVISGRAEFKAVLVYDVSRWGRFQDSDEAADYEFVCKHARIPVHYCAETFANNNSLPSSVMKAVKRAMAAEYSRELGDKVFAAEKRWAELGFKQAGSAGYALHRLMISSDGTRKQLLAKGEVKCLQSDHVVLVPGEPEEVACVREMYRLVVEGKSTPFAIARELNRRKLTERGRNWNHQNVYRILTHYLGHLAFGRYGSKRCTQRIRCASSNSCASMMGSMLSTIQAPKLLSNCSPGAPKEVEVGGQVRWVQ